MSEWTPQYIAFKTTWLHSRPESPQHPPPPAPAPPLSLSLSLFCGEIGTPQGVALNISPLFKECSRHLSHLQLKHFLILSSSYWIFFCLRCLVPDSRFVGLTYKLTENAKFAPPFRKRVPKEKGALGGERERERERENGPPSFHFDCPLCDPTEK